MDSEGFSQEGLNTNRVKKREHARPHTEGMRNTHAVRPVTDGSDRPDVDMDEPAGPDGPQGEVTDTVGTARVLAASRTPTKTEREENDVSHLAPLVSILCHGKRTGETSRDTVTVMMTDPECLLTTVTLAETQHHAQLQRTDALA